MGVDIDFAEFFIAIIKSINITVFKDGYNSIA